MYTPAATVKLVNWLLPSVGSTSGVAAAQSAAHVTRSPDATVPVSVMAVATPAVMVVGEMAVILLPGVSAGTADSLREETRKCSVVELRRYKSSDFKIKW